jgi:aminopeptidase N
MSTYLVCFVVGIFSHQKSVLAKEGFPVKVYSQPSQSINTIIARDLAKSIMDFYAEFLSEKYLLPKLGNLYLFYGN